VYENITIIGVGSLGGFLTKHISELTIVREITIVDFDSVESKNIFDSIYSYDDLGEYKVDSLYEIVKNNANINKLNQKYEEGVTILPQCDLVIDCRDVVCDRKNEINVRFSITDRTLVIDCRNSVKNSYSYDGRYSLSLTSNEINKAAFYAAQVIESGHLKEMIENNMIQYIDLDVVSDAMNKSIKESLSNRIDIIYDSNGNVNRLHCLQENIKPILFMNRTKNIEVFVGDRETHISNILSCFPEEAKTKYALIPKNSLTNSVDVINKLTDIIRKQPGMTNFIVTVKKRGAYEYVELLEETGAA
jgi:hypothetical protein